MTTQCERVPRTSYEKARECLEHPLMIMLGDGEARPLCGSEIGYALLAVADELRALRETVEKLKKTEAGG